MIEVDRARLVETLAELIRVPSINPDLVPGAAGEEALATSIARRLDETPGIAVELQDAGDGRWNVVATAGAGDRGTLMLNGHMDTVSVEEMTDPFEPRVADGRLYGRGAIDMKGALAGMIVLLEAVARTPDFPGRVVATFVADEEYASIGTQAICREIDRWRPDAALVLEATDLRIGIAHKGFIWAGIETHGRAAHGSQWQIGIDAITRMGHVLVGIDELATELTTRPAHRYVGPPSLHASLIQGGQEVSSYPAACRLEVERRTVPGETREQVRRELQAILDRQEVADPALQPTLTMGLERAPFEVDEDAPIVRALAAAGREALGREPELIGQAWWTDAALLASAGVPTALFGPTGAGAHGAEEWIDLDSLVDFTRVVARVAEDICR